MTASDNLASRQFHGTNAVLQPGDQLMPRNELGGESNYPNSPEKRGHTQVGSLVWSTDDPSWAAAHGEHTYEVQHNGLSNRNPGVHGATVSLGATVIKKVHGPLY